jgi:hypothetical protein
MVLLVLCITRFTFKYRHRYFPIFRLDGAVYAVLTLVVQLVPRLLMNVRNFTLSFFLKKLRMYILPPVSKLDANILPDDNF